MLPVIFNIKTRCSTSAESTPVPSDEMSDYSDGDSDDDCIILDFESDEEQGEVDEENSSNSGGTSSGHCDAQCCRTEDVLSKPYQVRDENILNETKKQQGKKWRQFIPDWYQLYTWLFLCIIAQKAFCYYCRWCSKKGLISNLNIDRARF